MKIAAFISIKGSIIWDRILNSPDPENMHVCLSAWWCGTIWNQRIWL